MLKVKRGCRITTCKTVTARFGLKRNTMNSDISVFQYFKAIAKAPGALHNSIHVSSEMIRIQVPTLKGKVTEASKLFTSWTSIYCKLRHSQAGHGPLSGAEYALSAHTPGYCKF